MEVCTSSGKLILFIALGLLTAMAVAFAQSASLKSAGVNLSVTQNMDGIRVPVWSGDSLVVELGMGTAPTSYMVYDRTGKLLQNLAFDIPGAKSTFIYNFARGMDGYLAICGLSYAADGRGAPFIALVSTDGGALNVIRTEPYTPNLITVVSDGSIWTVGYELNEKRGEESGVDVNAGVVRHFDKSGKTLHTFIPRSSLPTAVLTSSANGQLVTSGDRVGWFSFDNREGGYAELSASAELTRYPPPELPSQKGGIRGRGLAMTSSGDVYVSVFDEAAPTRPLLYRLDRKTAKGQSVALPDPTARWAMLFGANGADLVLRTGDDPASTFRFMRPAN